MLSGTAIETADLRRYPPLARQLVQDHLPRLRSLPVIFAALLLREISSYDWQFPVERQELEAQLKLLARADTGKLAQTMRRFAALPLSPELQAFPWVAEPERFVEKLTAYLWSVHAMDEFRAAATEYGNQIESVRAHEAPKDSRLCIVLIGSGTPVGQLKLFQKLRPHGTYFPHLDTTHALQQAMEATVARAKTDPAPYRHWYVDGGAAESFASRHPELVNISYEALRPMRQALLERMHTARLSGTVGPEDLRSLLAEMRPEQFQASQVSSDKVLQHFELQVLSEGSGTQIFSTTFVQWTARELLRRARPQTLLVRYGLRQADRPMNDLLRAAATTELDPRGSLIDADMGAYYTWLNLRRLPGAESSRFITFLEGGNEAIAIAPGMAQGAVSTQRVNLEQILRWSA
jgi:hypothetical protein